nr:hypothetical protein BdHM001_35260 [Bdellovibrio sp. HM001]
MQVPKPKRVKDRKVLDTFHAQQCVACRAWGCDPAHIKGKGAGGDDVMEGVIELCRKHHRFQHDKGWWKLCQEFPRVERVLRYKGWAFDEFKGLIWVGKEQSPVENRVPVKPKNLCLKGPSNLAVEADYGKDDLKVQIWAQLGVHVELVTLEEVEALSAHLGQILSYYKHLKGQKGG